jgi:hypothetical protein
MAEKLIRQQPVAFEHLYRVSYLIFPPAGIDVDYAYTPVDEKGNPVGEQRVFHESKTGASAQVIRDWIESKVLPEINAHEGT